MPEHFISAILLSLATGLHSMLVLGGLGAIFLAAAAETFSGAGKKAFMYKLSDQAGRLGALLLLYLALALAGSAWASFRLFPEQAPAWMADQRLKAFLFGIPGAVIVLGLAYRWLARPLKNARGPHAAIGAAAALSALAMLLAAAMTKLYLAAAAGTPESPPTIKAIFESRISSPETWAYFAQYALLSLCAGGALTLVYLLVRRNKDDYGRDYYVYTVRFASRWSAIFSILATGPFAFIAYRSAPAIRAMERPEYVLGTLIAFAAFTLAAALLFALVGRSETPMRRKPTIAAGAACVWLALASLTAFLDRIYDIFQKIGLSGG